MDRQERIEAVGRAIGAFLKELAGGPCRDMVSEESFLEIVVKVESGLIGLGDFGLSAANTVNDWNIFHVRTNGANEPPAVFEFSFGTGVFRRVGDM